MSGCMHIMAHIAQQLGCVPHLGWKMIKMKTTAAKQYIEDCRNEDGTLNEQQLVELIEWTYDQGWAAGIEDYMEERRYEE